MTRTEIQDSALALPLSERLHLAETIWNSVERDMALSPEHRRLLDEALNDWKANPDDEADWKDVRSSIREGR